MRQTDNSDIKCTSSHGRNTSAILHLYERMLDRVGWGRLAFTYIRHGKVIFNVHNHMVDRQGRYCT